MGIGIEAAPESGMERVFAIKDIVRVKRSSGEFDEGWEVAGTPMGGRLLVMKDGLRKLPKIEELREWNS